MKKLTPRTRKVRILATLGPSSSSEVMIRKLFLAGADAFRLNMSHGTHDVHAANVAIIRGLEKEFGRPTTILADLQGPKLRIGTFAQGAVFLEKGAAFRLDRDPAPGDSSRVTLPHPEIFAAAQEGMRLLIDDGKLVLRVRAVRDDVIDTLVEVGGSLSERKGVNVPDVVLPMAAMTEKDRRDLSFAIEAGVDWIALSFVQRPDDLAEARKLMGGYGYLLAKIEKPAALGRLEEIVEMSDAVMVARGDLGVELPPYAVPPLQKQIVESARRLGKPVVVATQMLESMIKAPTPTRAEVSDVATAVYDGADAVMLSAETAAGDWPEEAVAMMDSIAHSVEHDPGYLDRLHFTKTMPDPTTSDALAGASQHITNTVSAKVIVCFTTSGSTVRRIARERPGAPILALTPRMDTARRMGLMWGVHAVRTKDIGSFEEMIGKAKRMAMRHGFAGAGDKIIVLAGVPFGTPGSTNVLHVATIRGDELRIHREE
ncbi:MULTISPECIES: pyruvate kinase [unclassified Sphingobium]|uniref:pyruvate kinase n=1 Tax=unclassified Sphingobium TaxID=2611147 RepID=UPI002224C8C8|nr:MULTISPECIES: pyruvate kinase [unclassified Sphingobium]MCW2382807.1 pyruvate kinase [Sphingobium sp. B2D3B]MCW2397020.1 pyruvate kinase [Sphingobium sp. B2D3C]